MVLVDQKATVAAVSSLAFRNTEFIKIKQNKNSVKILYSKTRKIYIYNNNNKKEEEPLFIRVELLFIVKYTNSHVQYATGLPPKRTSPPGVDPDVVTKIVTLSFLDFLITKQNKNFFIFNNKK